MDAHKNMVETIIRSLRDEPEAWTFGPHTAEHKSGINLWITNVPILDLHVYRPVTVKLSLADRFRVYAAMRECRAKFLMEKFVVKKLSA